MSTPVTSSTSAVMRGAKFTDDLDRLYARARSFPFTATTTYLSIVFFDGSAHALGHFEASGGSRARFAPDCRAARDLRALFAARRVDPVRLLRTLIIEPMRILFLDIDGVLNRAGFQPEETIDLASWIEPELADRLDRVAREIDAELVLSSDWRIERSLDHLRDQLARAGVAAPLRGATPVLGGQARWREIEAWMVEHCLQQEDVVIVDDAATMGPLARRHVQISAQAGFDDAAAVATRALFASAIGARHAPIAAGPAASADNVP